MFKRIIAVLFVAVLPLTMMVVSGCSTDKASDAEAAVEKEKLPDPPADDEVMIEIGDRKFTLADMKLYWEALDSRALDARAVIVSSAKRLVNEYMMSEAAREVEGFDKRPGLMSKIYAKEGKLWHDYYWQQVVQPKVVYTHQDIIDYMPTPNPTVTIRQFISQDKTKTEEIRKRVLTGEDFENLIRESSEGLTKEHGGLIENMVATDARYTNEVKAAVFSSKVGDISEIFFIPIGYTFFRTEEVVSVAEWQERFFKKYEDSFRAELGSKLWKEELDRLVSKHEIVPNEEVVEKFQALAIDGKPLVPLFNEILFTLDGFSILVKDVVDPTGAGIIHGGTSVDSLINTFIEDMAIYKAAKERGLRNEKIEKIEEFVDNYIYAREYIVYRSELLDVTKDEIQEYYDNNTESFSFPASSRYSVIETKNMMRVNEIYKELEAGTPFGEVAKKWSDHPSKIKGGDIGWAPREKIAPDFVFIDDLAVGQYTKKPVEFGKNEDGEPQAYSIFFKSEFKEAGTMPLDQNLATLIVDRLISNKREHILDTINEELLEKYGDKVIIHQDKLFQYSDSLGDVTVDDEAPASEKPGWH